MNNVSNRASKVLTLEVNLSSGKVEKRDLGPEMRQKYLGSRGINSRILYDRVGPETDALSPESVLLIGAGVFAGTAVPSGSRMSVQGKSPAYVFGCTNMGGHFPANLRKAGYDHLIVTGKAAKPAYILIDNDKVKVRSAAHLWGKGTVETDRLIREEIGDDHVSIMTIGQAGENQVSFANIIVDRIRAGASRMAGLLLGSKNLKAIVVRGTGHVDVANEELVSELSRNLIKRIKETGIYQARCAFGGSHTQGMMCAIGAAPIKNLTSNVFDGIAGVSREEISKYFIKGTSACPACPMARHHAWEIKDGPYAGEKGVGLEGALIMSFAGMVGNSYAPAIFKSVNLINDYGLDGFELVSVISAAMEWYEKGILTKKDLDGMELKWGDHAAVIEMIHKIARKQGVGALFAEGPVVAARKIGKGAEECITQGKNRISGWLDWRVLKGGYLNEVTSSLACEMMDGWSSAQEVVRTLGRVTPEYNEQTLKKFGTLDVLDPLSYNKAASTIASQDFMMALNAVGLCVFITEWALAAANLKDVAELYRAVTGIETTEADIVKAANRIRDLERAYWAREGFTRKDDHLKGRIMNEPVPDGPFKGERMDPVKIEKMMDEYYQLRGWDLKTGIPTRKKLLADGLEDVVKDLEKRGVKLTK